MSILRRHIIRGFTKDPILVKLTDNPGVNFIYTLITGYKYMDMLIFGGGGSGGYNSGGGGASGTAIFVENLKLSYVKNKHITYNIAQSGNGNSSVVIIDGKIIEATGGGTGLSHAGEGGNGGDLLVNQNIMALTEYVADLSKIAIANNGGGAAGPWSNQSGTGASGAEGSSFKMNGYRQGAGYGVENGDGTGGYNGCSSWGDSRLIAPGLGYKRNSIIIPLKSRFGGGGKSGSGSIGGFEAGSGGGAAGYESGGDLGLQGSFGAGGGGGKGNGGLGGNGGQGIICFYYHN